MDLIPQSLQPLVQKRRRQKGSSEETYAGPLPTPPPSEAASISPRPVPKRVRRTQGISEDGSSSSANSGLSDVGDFRTGGPNLCHLPARNVPLTPPITAAVAWEGGMRERVVQALRLREVFTQSVDLVKRGWIEQPDEELLVTIIVLSDKTNSVAGSWLLACEDIRRIAAEQGFLSPQVEIADYKGLHTAPIYAVGPEDLIVELWNALKPQIFQALGPDQWISMDVLRQGWEELEKANPITVIILVQHSSDKDWTQVRELIIGILEAANLKDVAVRIDRAGTNTLSLQSTMSVASRVKFALHTEASLGASFGRYGQDIGDSTSATFGGLLDVQSHNGEWKTYGLTNSHAVAGSYINEWRNENEKLVLEEWYQNGKAPNDNRVRIEVAQPSMKDMHEHILELEKNISDIKENSRYKMLEPMGLEALREMATTGAMKPQDVTWFRDRSHALALYESSYAKVVEFRDSEACKLGHLYAASGITVGPQLPPLPPPGTGGADSNIKEGICIDWALLEIREERLKNAKNERPSATGYRGITETNFPARPGIIEDIAIPVADVPILSKLFKLGRTSGLTMGVLNGIRTLTNAHWRKDAGGVAAEMTTSDWCVVGIPKGNHFSEPGDSGSFILDAYGNFVGLLWGAGKTEDGMKTNFLAATDLSESIKKITGAKAVRLPGTSRVF